MKTVIPLASVIIAILVVEDNPILSLVIIGLGVGVIYYKEILRFMKAVINFEVLYKIRITNGTGWYTYQIGYDYMVTELDEFNYCVINPDGTFSDKRIKKSDCIILYEI